jgi:hypothetical protein
MWPFRTKRHLRYSSIEAWFKGEGHTEGVVEIADPVERDRRITEYGELSQSFLVLSQMDCRFMSDPHHVGQPSRVRFTSCLGGIVQSLAQKVLP